MSARRSAFWICRCRIPRRRAPRGSRLTDTQQGELRALSTRARITPSSFVNDYQWGDLKGDPPAWMERYFDALAAMIETKKPKEYDAAIVLVKDLQALAERDGDTATFEQQIWQLRQQHVRKPSLIDRLGRAALT